MHATKKLPPAGFRQALARALATQGDRHPRAERLTLALPWPPSTNNLYRSFVSADGQVRRAKTKRAREYAQLVKRRVREWAAETNLQPPARPFKLTLVGWPPDDSFKHDLTNTFKCVEDALFAAIYSVADQADDNEVLRVCATKLPPSGRGRIEITLETTQEPTED